MQPEPRREVVTWEEVDRLIDQLLPQFRREFTAMVMITRGGIIPGGLLAEAIGLRATLFLAPVGGLIGAAILFGSPARRLVRLPSGPSREAGASDMERAVDVVVEVGRDEPIGG